MHNRVGSTSEMNVSSPPTYTQRCYRSEQDSHQEDLLNIVYLDDRTTTPHESKCIVHPTTI